MNILLTGGAGYIGSHTAVELLNSGYNVIIADNFSNSSPKVLERIHEITGKEAKLYEVDVTDKDALSTVFKENSIDAVIHFAGYKAVGESCRLPLKYYRNNLDSSLTLLETMEEYKVNNIIFSSSATVYGGDNTAPYNEGMKTGPCTNPYGWTKLFIEQILKDYTVSNSSFSAVLLRYFNPVGAHSSGLIGEDPNGIPNNLMPYISQVAIGKLDHLNVFGNDYNTPDGTGVRDYIHVVDLAKGHVAAVNYVLNNKGTEVFNLGTGTGYSVLDILHSFEKACGHPIPYEIAPRRDGDIATCYSNPVKAFEKLGWKAQLGIDEMCHDSWNWQSKNPNGYK